MVKGSSPAQDVIGQAAVSLSAMAPKGTGMVRADQSDFETIRFQAALLNSVGQAVIASDVDGIVIYWNSAAERLHGLAAQEAVGRPIVALTPAPQSVEEATRIFVELAAGRSWAERLLGYAATEITGPSACPRPLA